MGKNKKDGNQEGQVSLGEARRRQPEGLDSSIGRRVWRSYIACRFTLFHRRGISSHSTFPSGNAVAYARCA